MTTRSKFVLFFTLSTCLLLAACNFPQFLGPGTGSEPPTLETETPPPPANTDGAEVIYIPGGTFWMGSEEEDLEADEDEFPRHRVTLGAYYIYTHEVTNGMYRTCVAEGYCIPVFVYEEGPTVHYADPEFSEHPVVGVDWVMAQDYCEWAGGRLPTEAEWELASRSTDNFLYPWGNEILPDCDHVNMLGCLVPPDTVPVGSFEWGNSPYEVWDMAGNVWEWVYDWYDEDYYTLSPTVSPWGPFSYEDPDNPLKVARGGGLYSAPSQMRSAARGAGNPYRAFDDVGFRCVPTGEVDIPEDYTPALDRHERVPPDPLEGGGEPFEDPDPGPLWLIALEGFDISCPDLDGEIHFAIPAHSTITPITFTVSIAGTAFDCYYDELLEHIVCNGLPPAGYDAMPGTIPVEVCYEHAHGSGCMTVTATRPLDCGEASIPRETSYDLDCPVDGVFTIKFYYTPPITWDVMQMNGVDIPCLPFGDAELRCTPPDAPLGGHYEFYLHGWGDGGEEFLWTPSVPVRDDCPGTAMFLHVAPFCFEDHPTAQVMFGDGWPLLQNVTTEGTGLDCIAMAPGVLVCGNLPQPAGTEIEVVVCFEGIMCSIRTITVPACPGPTPPGSIIEPMCYPPEDPAPAASIHYWPFSSPLVSALADAAALSCFDLGGGWNICSGVTGPAGETVTITACLEDASCFSGPIVIPACTGPSNDRWILPVSGCTLEWEAYFIINTHMTDTLLPGTFFEYSATDGEVTYTCDLMDAGRIVCWGSLPTAPGPLHFCLRLEGEAAPTCVDFPEWPDHVALIPVCEEPPPDDDEPEPSCRDYTDWRICEEHKECYWSNSGCLPRP
ncbi:MAG: formylglycine-generating enzyme family protein [Chloroflexi bacterium]|nr:formylglycine-generating enzyme family protein [Chloroflexota bacterium]